MMGFAAQMTDIVSEVNDIVALMMGSADKMMGFAT